MSVNKVILVGRCGGDAMVRMAGDKKVATVNLATSEKYTIRFFLDITRNAYGGSVIKKVRERYYD